MTDNDEQYGVADAIAEALPAESAGKKGGGGPTGIQACARASIFDTESDDKWAAAVTTWDQLRADIRKLPRDREVAAWEMAWRSMTALRAAVDKAFLDKPGGEG